MISKANNIYSDEAGVETLSELDRFSYQTLKMGLLLIALLMLLALFLNITGETTTWQQLSMSCVILGYALLAFFRQNMLLPCAFRHMYSPGCILAIAR